jgi:hypothetical protein
MLTDITDPMMNIDNRTIRVIISKLIDFAS